MSCTCGCVLPALRSCIGRLKQGFGLLVKFGEAARGARGADKLQPAVKRGVSGGEGEAATARRTVGGAQGGLAACL